MICIYHSRDLDGYCSGAIIKKKYPKAELIGYDYGQPFDVVSLTDEDVIMVDVSFPMEIMKIVSGLTRSFVYIDHHISAITEFKLFDMQDRIVPVFSTLISACEGAWYYCFPGEAMPRSVYLLGEYDTWRNQDAEHWNSEVMPFQWGMRLFCNSPETFPSILFDNDGFSNDEIIKQGKIVLQYQKQQNERACKSSFSIKFEGLRAICLNIGGGNSTMFESVYKEDEYDIMIPFFFSGKHWTFSLYTTKDWVDCSVIAKSKGGGGHKKAAGFQLAELPEEFKINVQ